MVKDCLVIGKTNVGKSEFVLNFAEYMGLKKVKITFRLPDGSHSAKTLTIPQARKYLVGPQLHKTRCLQSISLAFPVGKGTKEILLTDSAGITDGIHEEREVRKAIAQTLAFIRQADLVLHMVDAAEIGKAGFAGGLSEFDHQLARYGTMRGGYALLANKIDLPEGNQGVARLMDEFFATQVFPVSAHSKKGFKEVKTFVWRNL